MLRLWLWRRAEEFVFDIGAGMWYNQPKGDDGVGRLEIHLEKGRAQ